MTSTIAPEERVVTGPSARTAPAPAIRHESTVRPDDQPVLSIRASVPRHDADRFIGDALHDVRVFMQEHHLRSAGPPFSICRPRGNDLDIEAGWPTTVKSLVGTSRIHSGLLPRSIIGPRENPGRIANPLEQ
jgi:hypothetical protein